MTTDIEKFWEWCGCRFQPYAYNAKMTEKISDRGWLWPDGEFHFNLPAIDLNSLFKWAVPKVFRLGYNNLECKLDSRRDGDGYMWILTSSLRVDVRSDYLTDPAQALYQAIYKVMEVA